MGEAGGRFAGRIRQPQANPLINDLGESQGHGVRFDFNEVHAALAPFGRPLTRS